MLQLAIWLGPWTVSLSRVLTTWQTSVYWSVIHLCEVVALGVQSFGSTLCIRTWYQSIYEESLSIFIMFWNRCCWNFERVFGSIFFVHLFPMGSIPLCSKHRFHWEIFFVSSKTVFVCSKNTHFNKSEGMMLHWQICFIFLISHILSVLLLDLYCFSLVLLPSLDAYALFHTPCVIATDHK